MKLKYLVLILLVVIVNTILIPAQTKTEGRQVLVINSNNLIGRYLSAQNEFIKQVDCSVQIYDMNEQLDDSKQNLEQTIQHINPDILYCIGAGAYQSAAKYAHPREIIFSSIINWQRFSIYKNCYGISNEIPPAYQLTMFRFLCPDIRKIGIIYNPELNKEWIEEAIAAGRDTKFEFVIKKIKNFGDVHKKFNSFIEQIDALWLIPDPTLLENPQEVNWLFQTIDSLQKPIFAYSPVYENLGASLVVSEDQATIGRQAAGIAMDIIHRQPIDQQVQNPAGTDVSINLTKFAKYGVVVNPEALNMVNRIIE